MDGRNSVAVEESPSLIDASGLLHVQDSRRSDPVEGDEGRYIDTITMICGLIAIIYPDGSVVPTGVDWCLESSYRPITCTKCKERLFAQVRGQP